MFKFTGFNNWSKNYEYIKLILNKYYFFGGKKRFQIFIKWRKKELYFINYYWLDKKAWLKEDSEIYFKV